MTNHHCEGILQSNFTLFPNRRGDKSQEEASIMFEQVYVLVKTQCSKYLMPFLCGTYFPPCLNDSNIPLCPYLCEQSQRGCAGEFRNHGTPWSLQCIDYYRDLNKSSVCLGTNGVEKIGKIQLVSFGEMKHLAFTCLMTYWKEWLYYIWLDLKLQN